MAGIDWVYVLSMLFLLVGIAASSHVVVVIGLLGLLLCWVYVEMADDSHQK